MRKPGADGRLRKTHAPELTIAAAGLRNVPQDREQERWRTPATRFQIFNMPALFPAIMDRVQEGVTGKPGHETKRFSTGIPQGPSSRPQPSTFVSPSAIPGRSRWSGKSPSHHGSSGRVMCIHFSPGVTALIVLRRKLKGPGSSHEPRPLVLRPALSLVFRPILPVSRDYSTPKTLVALAIGPAFRPLLAVGKSRRRGGATADSRQNCAR